MGAVVYGKYFLKGPITRELSNAFICYMCYYLNDRLVAKGNNYQYDHFVFAFYLIILRKSTGEEFGMTIIFDSRNISLSQYDIEFISFLIDILTSKMPNIIKQIILYEVPW